MKAVVGHSMDPDTSQAALEVIEQCEQQLGTLQPKAGIVFAGIDVEREMLLEALVARWPDLQIVGCSSHGELSSQLAFQEDSVALMLLAGDNLQARAGVGTNLSADPQACANAAIRSAAIEGQTPCLVIAFPESLTSNAVSTVDALNTALAGAAPVVGGTAADDWSLSNTYQLCGRREYQDSVAVLALYGDIDISVGIGSGWTPLGMGYTVNNSEGNVVRSIAGRTALQFYRDHLGERVEITPEYPLYVEEAGSNRLCLRAPMGIDENEGSITFVGDVAQGSQVWISTGTRDQIVGGCERAIDDALSRFGEGEPSALLVFSCAARKQLLGLRTAEEYETLRKHIPPGTPVLGFYSYGEIAPFDGESRAFFHNETVVTVLLRGEAV